jgi:putative membrane protein
MKTFISTLILLAVFGCSNNNPSDQSKSQTNGQNSSDNVTQDHRRSTPEALNNEANVDDDEIKFIKMAGSSDVFEIELSKLVQKKAANARVKNFSIMMERDHTKNFSELKSLAVNKNVLVNYSLNPDKKKQIQNLQSFDGNTFDKHYIQLMISAHLADIELFKDGADNTDKALNSFANNTLPILKMHLDSAKAIQALLK